MAFPIVNGMRAIEFGSKGENRSHLNSLVLDANKRATAGHFKYDYEAEGEPLEFVGEKLAMLDNDGNAVATLLITRAELVRFADVSDEFAIAEGEGDLTGDEYRAGYKPMWLRMGYEVTDDTLVATVYFDLLEDLRPSTESGTDATALNNSEVKLGEFPKRTLLGLSRPFITFSKPNSNAPQVIGPLWGEMSKIFFSLKTDRDANPVGVGAMWCENGFEDSGEMTYFAGYEVNQVPEELGGLEVLVLEPTRYAWVEHTGPMHELPNAVSDFYSRQLPESGISRKQGIDLEIYYESDSESTPGKVVLAAPVA